MSIKPRHKRGLFWIILTLIAIVMAGLLVAPVFMNLNDIRPKLETAIATQTGIDVEINGDVTFGIVGKTTLVAHDVSTPFGNISEISVQIPFQDLFDIQNASLTGTMSISGAQIKIDSLAPFMKDYNITVKNSVITFLGKNYNIVDGVFSDGIFNGLIRTKQHKYNIEFNNKNFTITNKNIDLKIIGELYPSGGAFGTLTIDTDKINTWFEFSEPKINKRVKLSTNFVWDGEYGFKFDNIVANHVVGDIELSPNGWRTIDLTSNNISFDFSFLARSTKLLRNTNLNIDFYGDLTFENNKFEHLKIKAIGTEDYIQIDKIIADDTTFIGGIVDANGAHDIMIKTNLYGKDTECLFSGTPEKWECSKFKYGNIYGFIKSDNNRITAEIKSNDTIDSSGISSYIAKLDGRPANIKFTFANVGGTYTSNGKKSNTEYEYIYNQTLSSLNPNLRILPGTMLNEPGNIVWNGDAVTFIPNSNAWSLIVQNNSFYLTGTNIKDWIPKFDLKFLRGLEYIASGSYNERGDISNLTIKIAGHVFTGSVDANGITLKTDTLTLDDFLNREFFDHYEEMEFLTNAPIVSLFDIGKNLYLSANTLVYENNAYKNFVYSLKSGTQTFSITDRARGNLLATIIKEHSNYDIFIQLNNFVINGALLTKNFPLNIMNTTVTAELALNTSGHIAHDIWYNLTGDVDLTFDGGYIDGIGLDAFYIAYDDLTRLNIEDRLMTALESGVTKIKNMRIIGKYDHGEFSTTVPMEISMRHADAIGKMNVINGAMTTELNITMRGTAPDPVTVSVAIAPNGRRGYSMGEMIRYFDPAYMREFIKTHDKF
jgi:hypothetical protein